MLKIGDTVRFKGYQCEYEVVRIHSLKYVDLKIIKFDPDPKKVHIHPLGSIFPVNPVSKLEILKKVPRHPLTNIFR